MIGSFSGFGTPLVIVIVQAGTKYGKGSVKPGGGFMDRDLKKLKIFYAVTAAVFTIGMLVGEFLINHHHAIA